MGDKWGLGCGAMGHPPLPLGTVGAIRIYKTDAGYRARVLVRDYDGRVRSIERHARSKVAAELALKGALRCRVPDTRGADVTADSRASGLAEFWYGRLEGLSPIPMQAYRDR